nr:hypothetical protein [Melittangium boletus]
MSSRQKTLGGLALACVLATGCEPPPVFATADVRQQQLRSRIEGQVVVQGPVRGNAIVLLYDAERPPPPQGTGRPVSFTVIPREQLFGPADPSAVGPFTAPYAFSQVAKGHYLVRGFIDADTCLMTGNQQPCHTPDFIPWFTVTGEPNAGDVGGAALDASGKPRIVDISPLEDDSLPAATHVNVSFSTEKTRVPFDRPVFWVDGPSRFERKPSTLTLRPLQLQESGVDQRPPSFFVRLVDDNEDGKPDDANGDGSLDLWPRVLVRKLTHVVDPRNPAQGLADENDLDRNGVLDETGEDYIRENGSKDGQPDLVLLSASLSVPPEVLAQLNQKVDGAWSFQPVPSPILTLNLNPAAIDARDPRQPVRLQTIPPGRYSITLVQFTGQTWRVPNELDPLVATPKDLPATGLPPVATQSFVIEVP